MINDTYRMMRTRHTNAICSNGDAVFLLHKSIKNVDRSNKNAPYIL